MPTHGISRTRGGPNIAKDFFWYISNDKLIIQKIAAQDNGLLYIDEAWTHRGIRIFTKDEIINSLCWLHGKFENNNFPLANNVKMLGNGTEIDGFGVALYTLHVNTYYAQGSSYLGVVMEYFGVLTFVQTNVITWKFAAPYLSCDSITQRINECFKLANETI